MKKILSIIFAILAFNIYAIDYQISTSPIGSIGTINIPSLTNNISVNVTNSLTNNIIISIPIVYTNYINTYSTNYIYVNLTNIVLVTNKPPLISISTPANNSSFIYPSNINLLATASDTDGDIIKVEFYSNDILIGSDTTLPYSFVFAPAIGNYSLMAKAYDNSNAISSSSIVLISINSNSPPPIGNLKHVKPVATGNGSGSDWNNASSLPASFLRGYTYYIADGAYTSPNFNTTVSGASLITVKKATEFDHGSNIGWLATDGDSQSLFNGQVAFNSSYWVFDGQTGGGPNNWNSNFGFKVLCTSDGGAVINIGWSASGDNITIKHIDMQGKGSVSTSGGSFSNDGLANYGGANVSLSYCWLHGIGRVPFFIIRANNGLIEYCYINSYFGSSSVHSDLAVFDNRGVGAGSGSMGDNTFRYNLVTDIKSTGGLMWDNSGNQSANLYIYGNVFYKPAGATWDQANGIIGGWTGGNGEQFRNVKVYNNTFVNIDQQTLSNFPNTFSNNSAKNNLWINCQQPNFGIFTDHGFNHVYNSGPNQDVGSGSTGIILFKTDYVSTLDFSLSSNTIPSDISLSPQYRTDMFGKVGNTRGAIQF